MRRTYRSRKFDGGLERKDLISTIDEKSSVFDAFYIQNIKHTKRELSRVDNKSNVASSKVRKRKYVKRIVKDASKLREEKSRDDKSSPACLTPNKSIHVKKELDPFDLLLISSPAIEKNPVLYQRESEKKYGKKKTKKIIEYTYSDDETTDKENLFDLNTSETNRNLTCVKSHKLVIESENVSSLDRHEDSITSIVNKISLLRTISQRSQPKCQDNTHRLTLTTNEKSLGSGKSPLCSTPFQKKYRSKSIYNISPIARTIGDSGKLYNCATCNLNDRDDCKIINNYEDQIKEINDDSAENRRFLSGSNSFKNNINKDLKRLQSSQAIDLNPTGSIETTTPESSFDTSEITPLFGFNNSVVTTVNKDQINTKSVLTETTSIRESSTKNENFYNYSHCSIDCYTTLTTGNGDKRDSGDLTSEKEITDSELLYDTCSVNDSVAGVSDSAPLCPVVDNINRLGDSLFYKYYKKNADAEGTNSDALSFSPIDDESQDSSYCNKNANLTDLTKESCNIYFGNRNSSINKEKSVQFGTDCGLHNSHEDDESINFVTITRGKGITNTSIIYISDNSYTSVSGSEEDKIVGPNNMDDSMKEYEKSICAKKESEEEKIILTHDNYCLENDTFKKLEEADDEKCFKLSTTVVKTIKSNDTIQYNIHGENKVDSRLKCGIGSEVKTPVVLQPGKKWERSLSIYKRMTMADNFEASLLDNDTEHKGRKYRQSVITMMEMQKFCGSLHNESFNGRRSTFVCKPSRSTIKIVKENYTRPSICSSTTYENFKGLVSDDCDDTIINLSKLSIDDSVREVTVLEKFHDTSRDSTARDFVLRRCEQTDVLLFDECYPETELKNCHKIGEGVYGEVFLWRARDGRARVLKVIPIAGDVRVNGEPQKGYHEIISEIVIAMELSALRAPIAEIEQRLDEGQDIDASLLHSVQNATDVFNEVLAVRCVRGSYPARLLELWELYDECRGSDNDCPAALPARQHYLVLELRNAGQDLESYSFNSAEQAHALFLQLALGLAVAEEALQFEHRDLHWGNVLVSPTEQKLATFVVRGRVVRVPRRGVACAVIDYSLSRLTLGDAALYADLAADETLFEAVGDRQFAVYRLMRDRLGNDWKNFEPYTNVLWLEYIVDKMITSLRYKRTNTKIHKHYVAKLKAIKNRLLEYGSAAQLVLTDNEF